MIDKREILSAALSAHVSELRLFWRETGVSCRWLTPDAEHCLVDEEALRTLEEFREGADSAIASDEVRGEWLTQAQVLLDEDDATCVPFALRTLTWLLRVVESPHREDLTTDSWNLYLWSVRLADLPSRVLHKLSSQLEGGEKHALLDLDTLATKYYAAREGDFEAYARADESGDILQLEQFDRLRRFKNLVFYGIANIGKANLSKQLISQWESRTGREIGMHCVTVFHPGVGYAEMVERRNTVCALRGAEKVELPRVLTSQAQSAPYFFEPDASGYIEDGLFVSLCREAAMNPDKDYLFMVECIDRAKIEVVLGEIAYMLDAFARVPWLRSVEPGAGGGWDLEAAGARSIRLGLSGRIFFVPSNVYFLGTAIERGLFVEEKASLLQSFAFERLVPMNQEQLLRRMLAGRKPSCFARLEEYAEHSVALWAEINGILQSAGGETNLIGYGPLFSMCEEILKSADVHEAAGIVLGTWRYRMLPPILMKMTALLREKDNSHRQHLSTLLDSLNRSWLRTRFSLEGLPGSESIQVSYTSELSEAAAQE
ncbi:MAG: hypothetical protein WC966_08495 [Bradymonadales bacterium]|jgi:hypothetical protein